MQRLARDLALARVAAAARAVALVLDALALGTEIGDVGQRAVAAVAAVVQRDLDRLLDDVERRRPGGPARSPRKKAARDRRARGCSVSKTRPWTARLKPYRPGLPDPVAAAAERPGAAPDEAAAVIGGRYAYQVLGRGVRRRGDEARQSALP